MDIFKRIEKNDIEAIYFWLQHVKNKEIMIENKTDHDRTLLLYALQQNRFEVAKLLIDHGANVHAVDGQGNSTLLWAATLEKKDIFKMINLLLEKKVNIMTINQFGSDVVALLSRSVENQNLIKNLIIKGAYVDCNCYNSGFFSLFNLIQYNETTLDLDFIINNGVFLKEENKMKFKGLRMERLMY